MISDVGKIDILSLEMHELENKIIELGEKKFRAKQIYEWLHLKRITDFDQMTNISSKFRTKIKEVFCLKSLFAVQKLESCTDNTVKYLYRLSDGNHIETVLMEYNHGNSICVSTQVGCKMGCKFCASTKAGFKRNLDASEILLQIYETERNSGRKISSVVLMGIGEPLDNYDNVIKFMKILSSEEGTNMSLRHVSLSTCGIVPKIYELAKLRLGLTLSISLHAGNNVKRSEIMPINDKYDIHELIEASRHYFKETGRRISFEYSLIDGHNDSRECAKELAELLKGMPSHINLIPVNKIKENNFHSSRKAAVVFQGYLTELGLNTTIRRTLGNDINAACGQLRREQENI